MKKILQNLVALSAGLAVALVLAEVCVRLLWFGFYGFSPTQLNSFKNLGISGFLQPAAEAETLYELKPNLDTIFKFSVFQTNSFGMRDREYPVQKPAGTVRIAIIGDSFAMGSGVGQDEDFGSVLESLYAQQTGGQTVEVLNFGVGGYNLLNYEGVLNTKVLQFEPDLVVIGFCGGNDFEQPHPKHLKGNYKVKPTREIFYTSHFRQFVNDWRKGRDRTKHKSQRTPTADELAFVSSSFHRLKSVCDQKGIPVVVSYYSLEASEADVTLIATEAAVNDIPFVNVSASIQNGDPAPYRFHALDPHPNAAAHDIFGRELYSWLMAHPELLREAL